MQGATAKRPEKREAVGGRQQQGGTSMPSPSKEAAQGIKTKSDPAVNYAAAKLASAQQNNSKTIRDLQPGQEGKITGARGVEFAVKKDGEGNVYVQDRKPGGEIVWARINNKSSTLPLELKKDNHTQGAPQPPAREPKITIDVAQRAPSDLKEKLQGTAVKTDIKNLQYNQEQDIGGDYIIHKGPKGELYFKSKTPNNNVLTSLTDIDKKFILDNDKKPIEVAVKEIGGKSYYQSKEQGGNVWFEADKLLAHLKEPSAETAGVVVTEGKTRDVVVTKKGEKTLFREKDGEVFHSLDGKKHYVTEGGQLLEVKEINITAQMAELKAAAGNKNERDQNKKATLNQYSTSPGPKLYLHQDNNGIYTIYPERGPEGKFTVAGEGKVSFERGNRGVETKNEYPFIVPGADKDGKPIAYKVLISAPKGLDGSIKPSVSLSTVVEGMQKQAFRDALSTTGRLVANPVNIKAWRDLGSQFLRILKFGNGPDVSSSPQPIEPQN